MWIRVSTGIEKTERERENELRTNLERLSSYCMADRACMRMEQGQPVLGRCIKRVVAMMTDRPTDRPRQIDSVNNPRTTFVTALFAIHTLRFQANPHVAHRSYSIHVDRALNCDHCTTSACFHDLHGAARSGSSWLGWDGGCRRAPSKLSALPAGKLSRPGHLLLGLRLGLGSACISSSTKAGNRCSREQASLTRRACSVTLL